MIEDTYAAFLRFLEKGPERAPRLYGRMEAVKPYVPAPSPEKLLARPPAQEQPKAAQVDLKMRAAGDDIEDAEVVEDGIEVEEEGL